MNPNDSMTMINVPQTEDVAARSKAIVSPAERLKEMDLRVFLRLG